MQNYDTLVNHICALREAVQQQKPMNLEWQNGFAAAIRDVLIVLEHEEAKAHPAFPALYEMEPIGEGGHLEAVATLWFCSENCRDTYKTDLTVEAGEDSEYLDGVCCERCGRPIQG